MKIISGFNSTIPSVRKVRNWLLNDPNHMWIGRDRLVVFFILAGDEAANAFLPLEEVDYSMQDENIRAVLETTHLEEKRRDNITSRFIISSTLYLTLLMT